MVFFFLAGKTNLCRYTRKEISFKLLPPFCLIVRDSLISSEIQFVTFRKLFFSSGIFFSYYGPNHSKFKIAFLFLTQLPFPKVGDTFKFASKNKEKQFSWFQMPAKE